jgi:hypothetical protein
MKKINFIIPSIIILLIIKNKYKNNIINKISIQTQTNLTIESINMLELFKEDLLDAYNNNNNNS